MRFATRAYATTGPRVPYAAGPADPRLRLVVLSGLALLATLVAVLAGFVGGHGRSPRMVLLTPESTVTVFFNRYVAPDGRVLRTDQGDDTVSEGQAYALLMAVATSDRARFMSVWGWTQRHLLLADGLLAWHWAGGRVVGAEPAADGDLGTAAALAMAAPRFGDPSLLAAGRRLASAILAGEVVTGAPGPTLVAGPWAVRPTRYVDPSYLAPAELDELAAAFGGLWPAIASTADAELETLTTGGDLPSDWAVIGSDLRIHPAAAPGSAGAPATFGFDAARAPIWMALSCSAAVRSAAAGLQLAMQRGGGEVDLDLGGHPSPGAVDPVGLLADAASDWAAGRRAAGWTELEAAARANLSRPTYFASAWVALTVLGFDGRLERCPSAA